MSQIDDVRATFLREIEGVQVPVGLIDRAVASGRAMQRRRRLGTVVAGVACALAILVPAIIARPFDDGQHGPASRPSSSTSPRPGTTVVAGDPPAIAFAVGSTIFDGEVRVQAPGPVTALVKVGDEYAVLSPDGTGDSRLDIISANGASRAVDSGGLYGLAGGEVDGRLVIAWGGPFVKKLWLDQDTALELPQDPGGSSTEVLGLVGSNVVYAVRSDNGAPYVWSESTGVQGLVPDPTAVALTSLGPGVAQLRDVATGCSFGVRLDDPASHLWDSCVGILAGGQLTPDGTHEITGLEVADLTAKGAFVSELSLPAQLTDGVEVLQPAFSYGWEATDIVLVAGDPYSGPALTGIARCSVQTGACQPVALPDDPALNGPFTAVFASH